MFSRKNTEEADVRELAAEAFPQMESPGIVDQTIPGCPRKERDKKMKRRLRLFFLVFIIAPGFFLFKGHFYQKSMKPVKFRMLKLCKTYNCLPAAI